MDLLDWLSQILTCEQSPEDLDLEVLEDALDLLDARAEENLCEYSQPGEEGEEAGSALLAMAELLSRICLDLDAFLESFDFQRVRQAMAKAQELLYIRDGLTRSLCSAYSAMERSQVL